PRWLVAEHVLADEVDDALGRCSREMEAVEEVAGQPGPDDLVAIEVAVGRRRRLADVVEERGEPELGAVGGGVNRAKRVVPEVLAGDLVLADAGLPRELRRDRWQDAGVAEQAQPDGGPFGGEQPLQL